MPKLLARRELVVALAAGLLFRLLLLALSGNPDPKHDEKTYVVLALEWNHFGVYCDTERFLWPPGYPWLVAQALRLFGSGGLLALKIAQAVGELLAGASIAALAAHWFGARAGRIALWAFAFFVPLAVFSHFLYAESLFLTLFAPALWWLVRAGERESGWPAAASAGLLLGACALVKEIALPVVALGSAWLLWMHWPGGRQFALQRAALLVLAAALVVTPWGLRNLELYGRFAPSGMTFPENCFKGLNRDYVNLELRGVEPATDGSARSFARAAFVAPPPTPVRMWLGF